MTFGVTPDGFNRKTFQDIKSDFEGKQRAQIDANIDVSDETPLGQLNGIVGSALAEAWEGIEGAYHAYDPTAAEGEAMVNVALLTGTTKRGPEPSRVTCTLNLDAGTTVPAGSLIALDTREDVQFELQDDVTNSGGVTADLPGEFACTVDGPVSALATHLTTIVTPISGWNSVTNALDADVGHLADDDIALRQRRVQQLALRGGSTIDAIQADLLQIDTISDVEMLENTTDVFDPVTGLPGRTFEALVIDGGLTPDNDVAQAIFDSKPAGITSFGSSSGTATDPNGDTHVVRFSRPVERLVYVKMQVEATGLFPPVDGEDQVKAAVVARGVNVFGPGDDVTALALAFGAFDVPGVANVPSIFIGLAPAPTLSIPIPIGLHEIAKFDSTRIEVEVL